MNVYDNFINSLKLTKPNKTVYDYLRSDKFKMSDYPYQILDRNSVSNTMILITKNPKSVLKLWISPFKDQPEDIDEKEDFFTLDEGLKYEIKVYKKIYSIMKGGENLPFVKFISSSEESKTKNLAQICSVVTNWNDLSDKKLHFFFICLYYYIKNNRDKKLDYNYMFLLDFYEKENLTIQDITEFCLKYNYKYIQTEEVEQAVVFYDYINHLQYDITNVNLLDVFGQLFLGLYILQKNSIQHNDLHQKNILIDKNNKLYIFDWDRSYVDGEKNEYIDDNPCLNYSKYSCSVSGQCNIFLNSFPWDLLRLFSQDEKGFVSLLFLLNIFDKNREINMLRNINKKFPKYSNASTGMTYFCPLEESEDCKIEGKCHLFFDQTQKSYSLFRKYFGDMNEICVRYYNFVLLYGLEKKVTNFSNIWFNLKEEEKKDINIVHFLEAKTILKQNNKIGLLEEIRETKEINIQESEIENSIITKLELSEKEDELLEEIFNKKIKDNIKLNDSVLDEIKQQIKICEEINNKDANFIAIVENIKTNDQESPQKIGEQTKELSDKLMQNISKNKNILTNLKKVGYNVYKIISEIETFQKSLNLSETDKNKLEEIGLIKLLTDLVETFIADNIEKMVEDYISFILNLDLSPQQKNELSFIQDNVSSAIKTFTTYRNEYISLISERQNIIEQIYNKISMIIVYRQVQKIHNREKRIEVLKKLKETMLSYFEEKETDFKTLLTEKIKDADYYNFFVELVRNMNLNNAEMGFDLIEDSRPLGIKVKNVKNVQNSELTEIKTLISKNPNDATYNDLIKLKNFVLNSPLKRNVLTFNDKMPKLVYRSSGILMANNELI